MGFFSSLKSIFSVKNYKVVYTDTIDKKSDTKTVPRGKVVTHRLKMTEKKIEELQKRYIAFDVETTGFYPPKDKIVEVAAVVFENGVIVEEFSSLVNSGKSIPWEATAVNHITNEMLWHAPAEEEVYPQLIDFLGDALKNGTMLCAHNASFDMSFLVEALAGLGYDAEIRYLDTLSLARKLVKDVKNYKQPTLLKYFKISTGPAHRALADAKGCGEMMWKLLEMQYGRNIKEREIAKEKSSYNTPTLEELNVCLWVRDVLREDGQDTECLKAKRSCRNSIEVLCAWRFFEFKFCRKGSYAIIPKNIAEKSRLKCEPCVRDEGKTDNLRVFFNSTDDLMIFKKYICDQHRKNHENLQYLNEDDFDEIYRESLYKIDDDV